MLTRKINDEALAIIKIGEGCRLNAYQDVCGIWTIGYGHTALVKPDQVITQQEADDLLEHDVSWAARAVEMLTRKAAITTDNQFGAMVSLTFNIGSGNFRRSTVLEKHLTGDSHGAADAFMMWTHADGRIVQGLINRRMTERGLYLKG